MEKTIFLGECKWQDRPVSRSVLRQLVEKTGEIVPKRDQWQAFYLGFARDGWTEAAQMYAEEISTTEQKGRNWQVAGMSLLDLNRVDADLHDWTRRA